MVIFYPLIDIDVRIKVIYIDSSHIKLLRESLKHLFLAYKIIKESPNIYKNLLSLRLDVDSN